jgi:hypothetical protein
MKRIIWTSLLIILVIASLAIAYPSYLTTFNNLYFTEGTILDDCGVCHGASTSQVNSYGQSLVDSLVTHPNLEDALAAIEPIDSDGDGVTNINEIKGRSLPGDNTSTTPVEAATWGQLKRLYK